MKIIKYVKLNQELIYNSSITFEKGTLFGLCNGYENFCLCQLIDEKISNIQMFMFNKENLTDDKIMNRKSKLNEI
jgi:hypothetical protein